MSTPKFLLLLGPSAVGKSNIIQMLRQMDSRYTYISPYTNRPLRTGETDKVYIECSEMSQMAAEGKFLTINEKFGYRYATPRESIITAFNANNYPLLDWPVDRLSIMQEAFPDRLYIVYVAPPSLETLANRLKLDNRDPNGTRFHAATIELEQYWTGAFEGLYDLSVISVDGEISSIANAIHTNYLQSNDRSD